MADYSNMLRLSGYSEKFRADTVEGVLSRWEVILKEVQEKKRVLHRSTDQILQHKSLKGTVNNSTWFLKGENTTTMSVPITPSSTLRNRLQDKLSDVRGPDGGRLIVVEESGMVVTRTFPVPGQPKGCQYKDKCNVKDDTNCQKMGVIYSIL